MLRDVFTQASYYLLVAAVAPKKWGCGGSSVLLRKGVPSVDVDLFIKKMPQVVKELISREAFDNRR